MTAVRALWPPGSMDFLKKLLGYIFATGAPVVTHYVAAKAGPEAAIAAGMVIAGVGARVLHLQPSPSTGNP